MTCTVACKRQVTAERTSFSVPPLQVGLVRHQAPHSVPAHPSHRLSQTPSRRHPQLVRLCQPRLLSPLSIYLRGWPQARSRENVDEPLDGRRRGVQSEGQEDKRGRQPMRTELVPDDIYKPSDVLQPPNDMSVVRQIPVVVRRRELLRRVIRCP